MKITKWYFQFVLLCALVLTIYSSYYFYTNKKTELNNSLISRAESIAEVFSLQKELYNLSLSDEDVNDVNYQDIKSRIVNLQKINSDSKFVYILAMINDDVVFLADSEEPSSSDYSPPGQVYFEASDELKNIFKNGSAFIEGPYKDRWGTWISALAPITNNGEVKFVVGMDVNSRDYVLSPIIYALFPTTLFLLLFILISVGVYIRSKEKKIIDIKSQFVSIASHELRSPITGVRWAIESLLTDAGVDDSIKKILEKAHETLIKLGNVINELLDVSMIESKAFDTSKAEKVDLLDVLKDVFLSQELFAKTRNVKLASIEDFPHTLVIGDRMRLENVFNNIISNAIKYSKEGGIVEINSNIANDSKNIIVSVKDQGIGIPKDDLKKVKGGFFRSQNAKKYTEQGTGLGLYVCSKIIEAYGGSLKIESEVEVGTKVIIYLVLAKK